MGGQPTVNDGDPRRPGAAAFLAQALEIEDDVDALAADLVKIEGDEAVGVFAAEVDSSAGPVAFLVYAYALAARDATGRGGRERFESDLAVLETAAARDAPGPRPVAHAESGDAGYILATSPAVLRVLAGDAEVTTPGGAADLPPGDPAEARRAAAEELLRLLRSAEEQATAWLAAVRASEVADPGASERPPRAPLPPAFSPEETELALSLLEGRTRNLLQTFEFLLAAARDQTARGTGGGSRRA